MSGGQQGIQKLIKAEAEAQQIIQKARDDRAARMKLAREEAGKEVEAVKSQKEAEFVKEQSLQLGSTNQEAVTLKKETEAQLQQLSRLEQEKGGQAIAYLLAQTIKI